MKISSSLLMVTVLCVSLLAGCVTPRPVASASSSFPALDETTPNLPQELLALRFEGYENMSISEYREQAIGVIAENEAEYLALIEQISADSELQDIRYTNADAYFIANILIPTIAEKWETWRFINSCVSDGYMAEYTIRYSILDADSITMGERNRVIFAIMDGIQEVLSGRTGEQLADETGTKAALDAKTNELTKQFATDGFQIEVDLSYRAEVAAPSEQAGGQEALEERGSIGTETDYRLLLSLKTEGYANVSVSDFLQSYTELAQNPDFQKAYARVSRDIFNHDVRVDITDEEMSFLETTLEATSQEFIAQHHAKNELPTLRYWIERQRSEAYNGHDIAVFELFVDYKIVYSISDDAGLMVGERDTILLAIVNDMRSFVDGRTEDELAYGQSALEAKTERLEQQYSNGKIQLKINIISYRADDQSEDVQALQ